MMDTKEILDSLLQQLSELEEVRAAGISGGLDVPNAGEGDIDVFLYCDRIPEPKVREVILQHAGSGATEAKVSVFTGGNWGTGDFIRINGVETWLMYFTINETLTNVEEILAGKYPDREGYYYPVGRLAMLKKIHIIFDKIDFLNGIKRRLNEYPKELAEELASYHLEQLKDTEDFERAVARRDVLFYHVTLDNALDHFLQALFAMNKTFFPSRKRNFEHMKKFQIKPERCEDKILEIIRLGSTSDGIERSYRLLNDLIRKLMEFRISQP